MSSKKVAPTDDWLFPKWERQKWETNRSFEVFSNYRDMGHHRSLRKLAKAEGYSSAAYCKEMSRRYHWQERVEAYDQYVQRNKLLRNAGIEEGEQAPLHLEQLTEFMESQRVVSNRAHEMADKLLERCEHEMRAWENPEEYGKPELSMAQIATTAQRALALAESAADAKAREMGIEEVIAFLSKSDGSAR